VEENELIVDTNGKDMNEKLTGTTCSEKEQYLERETGKSDRLWSKMQMTRRV
jgi:hypothetical protein